MIELTLAAIVLVTSLMLTAIIVGERSRSRVVHEHAKRLESIVHETLKSTLDGDDLESRRLRQELLKAYEAALNRKYDGGF